MPLHSVGRKLQTVGNKKLYLGGNPVLDERSIANLCPPFSQWTLTGGATVDADGVLTLPVLNASAKSPLLPVNGAPFMTFSSQLYTSVASPYASFNGAGGRIFSANYFAANGTTAVTNSLGNTSNGNAKSFPLNVWSNRTTEGGWNINGGPNVVFVRWTITADATYSSKPLQVRNPMFVPADSVYNPYGHYYRKGL